MLSPTIALMNSLDFLVPDALIPRAHFGTDSAPELLRGLNLPHLNFLAAHAAESIPVIELEASLAVWQAWLLRDQTEPNLAAIRAEAMGLPATSASRWLIEPVFLQVGLDSVTLFDPAQLDLNHDDAAALAEAARPVLKESGWQLDIASPLHWMIERSDDFDLHGVAIEHAIGQGISEWLPHSSSDANQLVWKRVVNEIQMTWFTHPVNLAREAVGQPPVNGLWLSGNGHQTRVEWPYAKISTSQLLLKQTKLNSTSSIALETFDHLSAPTRAQDWSSWRNALQALDLRLGDVLQQMRDGQCDRLRLVLCGEDELRDVLIRRSDFWKFWRRGQALDLLIG